MAININPYNAQGLAALAGNPVPRLGLKTYGIDAGSLFAGQAQGIREKAMIEEQRRQIAQKLAMEKMKQMEVTKRAMMEQAVKQQEGALDRQSRMDLAQLKGGIDMRGQDLTAESKQSELSFKERKAMIEAQQKQQELQEKVVMNEFKRNLDLSKDKRESLGQIFNGYLVAASQAESPEKLAELQSMAIVQADEGGLLDKEERERVSKLTPEQFFNYGRMKAKIADMAERANAEGIQIQNGKLVYKQPVSKTTANTLQGKVVDAEVLRNNLEDIGDSYATKFLTSGGKYSAYVSKLADKVQDIPLVGSFADIVAKNTTGLDKKEREGFITEYTSFVNKAEQTFQKYRKAITGAQASDREIKMLREIFLNPDMSPTEFKSSLQTLYQSVGEEQDINKKVLREGVDVAPNAAKKVPMAEIQQVMDAKGMTREEVESTFNVRGE